MSLNYERQKVLIWGKTYPQLSSGHRETVCTGACLEDGTPIRLYPIPFRYLSDYKRYELYEWIELPIANNESDSRPESYKAKASEIDPLGKAGRERGWAPRREIIFKDTDWHYVCLDQLKKRQQEDNSSLGIVQVADVEDVYLEARDAEDKEAHHEKLEDLKAQSDFFQGEQKHLDFLEYRVKVEWRCGEPGDRFGRCPGHSSGVYDWGLNELGRRDGFEAAKQKMEDIANLSKHDLHLYTGNIRRYPTTFIVIGLWYPKREDVEADREQTELFN